MKKSVKKLENDSDLILDGVRKNRGIKDVGKLKRALIVDIDRKINELYKKRDFLYEVNSKKLELLRNRISVWGKIKRAKIGFLFRCLVSMPFIYMMLIPAIILHFFLEIYHQICFRLYRIPLVKPSEYFIFDRGMLPYLNWLEKINCVYCSYFNCLTAYTREIAGRTERFWCPIKHAKRMRGSHSQYGYFVGYNKGREFRKKWKKLRMFLD